MPIERWACGRSRLGLPIPRKYPSRRAWLPRNSLSSTAPKNCEKAPKWKSRTTTAHLEKVEAISRPKEARTREEEHGREPLPSVYPTSGRDNPFDGGHSSCRIHRLSTASGFGPSPGRLPDHSGADLLSWRKSGRDGLFRDRAIGAPVRTDAGVEPGNLHQFERQFSHHAAIQFGSQPGHRRAGG